MYFVRTKNKYLGNTVLRITDCNVAGGRVFKSMVNISGPVLSAGPLTATRRLAGGGGGAASSPPRSRDSTPGIPPLTIAHGAQVHAAFQPRKCASLVSVWRLAIDNSTVLHCIAYLRPHHGAHA